VQLGVNARLAPPEQVRQFRLLGTKWTAGGGELTPTLKPRQQVITDDGPLRREAESELHARLVRIALAEVNRRAARTQVTGPELTDVAHQAAGDAVLAKLAGFRGESRFTSWACRFVILEVSSKLGRRYWRNPTVALDAAQWERLPDVLGIDPEQHAESAGIRC
jgi:hypothetical protein